MNRAARLIVLSLLAMAAQACGAGVVAGTPPALTPTEGIELSPHASPPPVASLAPTSTLTPAVALAPTHTLAPVGTSPVVLTPTLTQDLYRVTGVRRGDVLNIRSAAGAESPIVGVIPWRGFDIRVTGAGIRNSDSTWFPVAYRDLSGWVNGEYLALQSPPVYGETPGELTISEVHFYGTAGAGFLDIGGEIHNGTDQPLTNVLLTLRLTDKTTGNSVLLDANDKSVKEVTFAPFLPSLAPGEDSPFIYHTNQSIYDYDYSLAITGYQSGAATTPARLEARNVRFDYCACDIGTPTLLGEIVNLSGKPAWINGLAGALENSAGDLVTADEPVALRRYLAPAGDPDGYDRSPFMIRLGESGNLTDLPWIFFIDADEVEPIPSEVSVEAANHYIDIDGAAHEVQLVTNRSNQTVSVSFLAAAHAKNGSVVYAALVPIPYALRPGESVPLDALGSFTRGDGYMNFSLDRETRASSSYSVQTDPSLLTPVLAEVAPLTSRAYVTSLVEGEVWAEVEVLNDLGNTLAEAVVVVAVYDAERHLVASGWVSTSTPPYTFDYAPNGHVSDSFDPLPGRTNSFSLFIPLKPGLDPQKLTVEVFAQGIVK